VDERFLPMSEIQIIDNPKLKGFLQTLTEWTFTTVMWALWIYLFLPLLNMVLWLLGIHYFYLEVIEKGGYMHLLGLLRDTGISLFVILVLLRAWGHYNYVRFGKRNRRKDVSETTVEELAGFFQLPTEVISDLQGAGEVTWSGQWRNDHALSADDFADTRQDEVHAFNLPSEVRRSSLAR
jgi:biofilm PGA synthesis protein PgaD